MAQTLERLEARPKSLTEIAFEAIYAAIRSGKLAPGSTVNETTLAAELDVSKTPVREAVLRLRQMNLIVAEGRRLHVVSPSRAAIAGAYELRLALESRTVELAAEQTEGSHCDELDRLAALGQSAYESNDTAEFRRCDVEFHRRVAESSGSSLLAERTSDAIVLTDVLRERDAPMTAVSQQCAQEHSRLAEAIRGGRPDDARKLITTHIEKVHKKVLAEYVGGTDQHEVSGSL